ncbi:MAG: anti-sigma factor family protein [Candidatus Aquicultor sp.]
MDCKRALLFLPAYYDKDLDRSDRVELEAHLDSCAGCSTESKKIEKLADALKATYGIGLPLSLAGKFRSFIRRSRPRYLVNKFLLFFVVQRREIISFTSETAFLSGLVLMTIGVVTMYSWWVSRPAIDPSPTETVSTVPLMPKPAKSKAVEPGAEKFTKSESYVSSKKALPQVVISNKRYDRDDIGDIMLNEVILDHSSEYSIAQATPLQDRLVMQVADKARLLGEDGACAQRCVNTALAILNKPALPAYIEKARFRDKPVWLVVLIWNTGNPSERLSKASVFAIDAAKNSIVYTE